MHGHRNVKFVVSFVSVCLFVCMYVKLSSILVLLESSLQTCVTYSIAEFTVSKLLMMDRGTVRKM